MKRLTDSRPIAELTRGRYCLPYLRGLSRGSLSSPRWTRYCPNFLAAMAKRSRLVARSLRAPKKAEALSESEGVAIQPFCFPRLEERRAFDRPVLSEVEGLRRAIASPSARNTACAAFSPVGMKVRSSPPHLNPLPHPLGERIKVRGRLSEP